MQHTLGGNRSEVRIRRSRRYMLLVLLVILLVTGLLFAYMLQVSAKRAAQHKHSFMEYVDSHHIGSLTEIDTGTGLDPMSYILTVNHVIPDSDRKSMALDLIHRYYQYDHGQTMTIVYVDPATHKQLPVAEANYNDDEKELTMTITLQSGEAQQFVQQVNW